MLSKEELKIKNLFKIKNSEIKPPSGSFEHTLKKNDILPMLIITVIYAVVALIGLGDKTCPQSFYSLPQRGSDVIIIPTQPTKLSGCSLYSGLGENTYYFQGSEDGINYIDIGQLTPKGVFRWEKMEFYHIDTPFRALRVIVNGEMQLGELVLYDGDGTQMPTSALTVSENGTALFDEAETVPKKVSYRNGTYFDEVYHARTAYEHINGIAPYEISHPPLGKLIISIGVRLFGMTPFGWRFMGALLGVLMLPLLYTLLKCLFGNTLISVCGTVVFAFDFMHFVQTRIATIDSYAVFFILLMYLCFYLFLRSDKLGQPAWKSRLPLALAGLFFGIGCACKWTVLYGGIGLGVLWLMHWVGRLHTEGKTAQQAFWSNVRWCLLFFVAVPLFVY
ncbi:MAG: phospholipid carrier-dependent glycosyltransferase, partial [Oscillospiraceae bacterium]